MYDYHSALAEGKPAAQALSAHLRHQLHSFVAPVRTALDARIDLRLVRTFERLLEVLLLFRHRNYGLLLSELGGYLLGPDQAPAGTKRLSNFLRCPKWNPSLLAAFLWQQAHARVTALHTAGEEALVLWDESVLEKPESQHAEGLGAVRSSKAARLKRIKPGFYTPPGGPPVFVPGVHWLSLLVIGATGAPTVALMRWWSNRSHRQIVAEEPRAIRKEALLACVAAWGRQVLHVWDRGYAGSPWLGVALEQRVRFVLRWPKGWKLQQPGGEKRPAWQFTRGQRSWDERYLRDPHRNQLFRVGVLAVCVAHADYAAPLWLVVARSPSGKGRREPWYLLTNEPIETAEDAWRIVLAYARRWQIEMCFRYGKSELALESPRLWSWERRVKLLLVVTLVYAFLLSLLDERLELLREWLLRYFCHRTGKRSQETPAPLYRLRSALSRLWLAHPSPPVTYGRNPG
jgi:hypothetical protein